MTLGDDAATSLKAIHEAADTTTTRGAAYRVGC